MLNAIEPEKNKKNSIEKLKSKTEATTPAATAASQSSKKPKSKDTSKSKNGTEKASKIKFSQIAEIENSISSFEDSDDDRGLDDPLARRPRGGNINRRKPVPDMYRHNLNEDDENLDDIYQRRMQERSQLFDETAPQDPADGEKKADEAPEKFKFDLELLNKQKLKFKALTRLKIKSVVRGGDNGDQLHGKQGEHSVEAKDAKTESDSIADMSSHDATQNRSRSAQFDLLLKRMRYMISGGEDISQEMASLKELGDDWLLKWCIIQESKIKECENIFRRYDVDNNGFLIGDSLASAIAEVCELDKFKMNYLFSVLDLCGADPFKNGVDIKLFAIMLALAHRIAVSVEEF